MCIRDRDKQLIKLITEEEDYYIIKANKEKLCCGCDDIIIGPTSKIKYENELKKIGKLRKLYNSKHLKRNN